MALSSMTLDQYNNLLIDEHNLTHEQRTFGTDVVDVALLTAVLDNNGVDVVVTIDPQLTPSEITALETSVNAWLVSNPNPQPNDALGLPQYGYYQSTGNVSCPYDSTTQVTNLFHLQGPITITSGSPIILVDGLYMIHARAVWNIDQNESSQGAKLSTLFDVNNTSQLIGIDTPLDGYRANAGDLATEATIHRPMSAGDSVQVHMLQRYRESTAFNVTELQLTIRRIDE